MRLIERRVSGKKKEEQGAKTQAGHGLEEFQGMPTPCPFLFCFTSGRFEFVQMFVEHPTNGRVCIYMCVCVKCRRARAYAWTLRKGGDERDMKRERRVGGRERKRDEESFIVSSKRIFLFAHRALRN